jgi:hypothetical protein
MRGRGGRCSSYAASPSARSSLFSFDDSIRFGLSTDWLNRSIASSKAGMTHPRPDTEVREQVNITQAVEMRGERELAAIRIPDPVNRALDAGPYLRLRHIPHAVSSRAMDENVVSAWATT